MDVRGREGGRVMGQGGREREIEEAKLERSLSRVVEPGTDCRDVLGAQACSALPMRPLSKEKKELWLTGWFSSDPSRDDVSSPLLSFPSSKTSCRLTSEPT